MPLQNDTPLSARLYRGALHDSVNGAWVVARGCFRRTRHGLHLEGDPWPIFDAPMATAFGTLTARCKSLRVEAHEEVSLQGATVALEARRGDATMKANDRVRLDGEQVLLNCDDPEPVPAWMATRLGASLVEAGPSTPRPKPTGG